MAEDGFTVYDLEKRILTGKILERYILRMFENRPVDENESLTYEGYQYFVKGYFMSKNFLPFLASLFLATFAIHSYADDPSTILNPDISYTMPSGASFNVPKGWNVKSKDKMFILTDPDNSVTMVMSESEKMAATDAIHEAWINYEPDFSSPIIHKVIGKSEVWDQIYRFWYFVPNGDYAYKASEKRGLFAMARQRHDRWYVGLMEYEYASGDKRQAQIDDIFSSIRLAGEKPTPTPATQVMAVGDKFFKVFEDFVEHARNDSKVPGAAVAIVKDGKIVYEKGFGVCEIGKEAPVTPKTLFSIASMTKPLTSLLMARLVDAGKVSWDTPVTQLMPGFQLADPKTTSELTLKYTVCACAGLPRQDMEMVFGNGYDNPEAVIEKMRTMVPTTGFGETFQYSNLMVASGGFAVAHAIHPDQLLSQAYQAAMKEYVLDPLGMADTTFDYDSVAAKEHATPHCLNEDCDYVPVPLEYNRWVWPVAPAAGAWSNVEDMSKYLLLELNKGLGPDGTRIVTEANILKRRDPQVKINDKSFYGLALMILDDKGVSVVGHGGNSTGFTSDMEFFPDKNMGIVLLANGDQANYFRNAVYAKFLELISARENKAQDNLNAELNNWKSEGVTFTVWARTQVAQSWFYDFVGNYMNEDLGHVSLKMNRDGGTFDTGKWKSHVVGYEGRNGETWFYLTDPPFSRALFKLKDEDGHKTMTYKTPQKDYVFEWVSKGR